MPRTLAPDPGDARHSGRRLPAGATDGETRAAILETARRSCATLNDFYERCGSITDDFGTL